MKIDIHVHTKKTKNGDAKTRDITPKKFCEIVTSTDVKIIAITNHNVFDLTQYEEIIKELKGEIQVWPGVELDIVEDEKRGHLIVIVSPEKAKDFSLILNGLTKESTPDTFNINIDSTLSGFDKLNPLYIAHYRQKKPDINEEGVNKIIQKTSNKNRVIKEVGNSISAGILISHGHQSIFGSDIHDWDKYKEISKRLPDLRLPVESFEQFCLLLEKDDQTINTILDKKTPENMTISPFEDDTTLELRCHNDINIFFGSKGTGKSKILEAISKFYQNKGVSATVFEPSSSKLEKEYDLKGKNYTLNLENHEVNYCTDEIDFIKKSSEEDVTNLNDYRQYFSSTTTNRNANKFVLKNLIQQNTEEKKREFDSYEYAMKKMNKFKQFIEEDDTLKNVSSDKELGELLDIINKILGKIILGYEEQFISWKQNELFNKLITIVNEEISKKTGSPKKPSTTGFRKYASNRIMIEIKTNEILANINKKIKDESVFIGSLGKEKGDLYCKTQIVFQNGEFIDANFTPVNDVNKKPLKEFGKIIKEISDNIYSPVLFEKVSELNNIDDIGLITSLHKLALFYRYFAIDDKSYQPSNGESSMLLLHKELNDDKDVYILDEPEKSLGNDYINDVIVPLINEKAKSGKKIFISTHDANIAVRTLPYNSTYREHTANGYKTYVGNPFSNNLINIDDQEDKKDWKAISMKTLEGGVDAFGERGKIYGKV